MGHDIDKGYYVIVVDEEGYPPIEKIKTRWGLMEPKDYWEMINHD